MNKIPARTPTFKKRTVLVRRLGSTVEVMIVGGSRNTTIVLASHDAMTLADDLTRVAEDAIESEARLAAKDIDDDWRRQR